MHHLSVFSSRAHILQSQRTWHFVAKSFVSMKEKPVVEAVIMVAPIVMVHNEVFTL